MLNLCSSSNSTPISCYPLHITDGYPSNGDETDGFLRSSGNVGLIERSMSPPRNRSPLVLSSSSPSTAAVAAIINGNKVQQMLGEQVSVEVKSPRDHQQHQHHLLSTKATTILAVPNLSQVVSLTTTNPVPSTTTQLPLTAINLSSATNPNNHLPNGILNIPAAAVPLSTSSSLSSSTHQQIFTSTLAPSFVSTNGNGQSHVIMKGGGGQMLMNSSSANGFNNNNKSNGLIIKEAATGKFGNGGDLLEPPPTKIMKLVNGMGLNQSSNMNSTINNDQQQQQMTSQGGGGLHQHTQVLPIYSSTQNGGLRVIGHHTTTTTTSSSTANGGGAVPPTNLVFTDPTAKYHQQQQQQHLPSGMVISAPLGGTLPASLSHQYLTNTINGVATNTNSTNGAPQQVHKLLLTGMAPSMMAAQSGAYALPQIPQSNDMFSRGGSTSLPGGAQLNLCRSSTPSPTISISAAGQGKGNNGQAQKGEGVQKIFF